MAEVNDSSRLLDRLHSLSGYDSDDWPGHIMRHIEHYGICKEMLEFIEEHPDATAGDVSLHMVFAFREKPDRIVWTEEEFRAKAASGEVNEHDVIQMADGFVPPQL